MGFLVPIVLLWCYLAWQNRAAIPVDYALAVEHADSINWLHLRSLYHPLRPSGYAILIRLLFSILGDYRVVGILVSVGFGLACIVALDALWRRFDWTSNLRIVALALVCVEPSFVSGVISPGRHMVELLLFSLACLIFCKPKWTRRDAAVMGLMVGFGSLIRYRLAWFAILPLMRMFLDGKERPGIREDLLPFVACFLLPLAGQLTINLIATGTPFGGHIVRSLSAIHPATGFWDAQALSLMGGSAQMHSPGWWLIPAWLGNAMGDLKSYGHAIHFWVLFVVPGLLLAVRGRPRWSPIHLYAAANGFFLLVLPLSRPGGHEILILIPPTVLFGLWFVVYGVFPHLTQRPTLRRRLQIFVLTAGLGTLAALNFVRFASPNPQTIRNIDVDRFLETLEIDPRQEILQIGTGFARCRDPRPLLYPIHDGIPPASELTVEQLKEIMVGKKHPYLLTGASSLPFGFQHLWALRDWLAIDPEMEIIESWDDAPEVTLFRLRPTEKERGVVGED